MRVETSPHLKNARLAFWRSPNSLYRLLDWLMRLPEGLDRTYKLQLKEYEERKVMPYVTSFARLEREEGRQEGRVASLREDIEEVLEARFGSVSLNVREQVSAIADATQLKALLRLAVTCGSATEFEAALG